MPVSMQSCLPIPTCPAGGVPEQGNQEDPDPLDYGTYARQEVPAPGKEAA